MENRTQSQVNNAKIAAHIIVVIKKVKAYLEYLSYTKWKKAIATLDAMIEKAYEIPQ